MTTINQAPRWTKGDVMRKARETMGLTQKQLAEKLGEDVNTVRRVEADSAPIKASRISAWAFATGVPVEWLQWSLDSVGQGWSPWGTGEDIRPDLLAMHEQRARRDSNPQPSDLYPRRRRERATVVQVDFTAKRRVA